MINPYSVSLDVNSLVSWTFLASVFKAYSYENKINGYGVCLEQIMLLGLRNSTTAVFFFFFPSVVVTDNHQIHLPPWLWWKQLFPTEFSVFPVAHNGPTSKLPWAPPLSCIVILLLFLLSYLLPVIEDKPDSEIFYYAYLGGY